MESRTKRKPRRSGLHYAIFVTVLALMITFIFWRDMAFGRYGGGDIIVRGVTIDHQNVSGMDREEAVRHLNQLNQERIRGFSLRLTDGVRTWDYAAQALDLYINVEDTVDEALKIGRRDPLLHRIFGSPRRKNPESMHTQYRWNGEKLAGLAQGIAAQLDSDPVDARTEFFPDAPEMFVITPDQPGRKVNTEELKGKIEEALVAGTRQIRLEFEPQRVQPEVTREDWAGKTELISAFTTDLSFGSADRTHNVRKAAMAFHGLVVPPGRVVSFNLTTGERTLKTGYRNAPVILADKSMADAPGGGVSQTATTLYNAVIRAGLDVVEAVRHSFPVSYVDMGLDTTVNLPAPILDLKFKNTRETPVYIRVLSDSRRLTFEIYGEPLPNGEEIRIRTYHYETVPAPEARVVQDQDGTYVRYTDETYEHVRSREGYKVRVYQDYYRGAELIRSVLLDDHYYRPIQGIRYTGVHERPVSEPGPPEEIEIIILTPILSEQ